MPFWNKLKKIPNYSALGFIAIYRVVFSPSVGFLRYIPGYPRPSCIFYPTCSEYGMECFRKYSFSKATIKTVWRIARCHPFNTPSVDIP